MSRYSTLKTLPLFQWLLSVRNADEGFLQQQLKNIPKLKLIDVACGVGKISIANAAETAYGVDIEGFPTDVAVSRGYCIREYMPPEYKFELPEEVNAVTCVDLNAHVNFDTFVAILKSAFSHLSPTGKVLLVCEFNNEGIGYKILKMAPRRFEQYVLGMKHWHFTAETEFLERLEASIPNLRLVERCELVCIPPLSHFYACFFDRDVNKGMQANFFLIGDMFLSLINNILRLFPKTGRAFRVGFVYDYNSKI